MIKIRFLLLIFFIFFSISCSNEVKKSIIIEKNIEDQILQSYNEGLKELEAGDALFAAKNLMKLK